MDPRLSRKVFAPQERAVLEGLAPGAARTAGFFAGWTRKEAYLKGVGLGLRADPRSVTVTLTPDAPAALLGDEAIERAPARWRLFAFTPGPGFAGALAVEAAGRAVALHRRWPPR